MLRKNLIYDLPTPFFFGSAEIIRVLRVTDFVVAETEKQTIRKLTNLKFKEVCS